MDMLVVRRSVQNPAPYFVSKGKELGLGLFMPRGIGGKTEDLVVSGPHVHHIPDQFITASSWKRDYRMRDLYKTGMVFVPATREIRCKMFRAQHRHKCDDPSHQLTQVQH